MAWTLLRVLNSPDIAYRFAKLLRSALVAAYQKRFVHGVGGRGADEISVTWNTSVYEQLDGSSLLVCTIGKQLAHHRSMLVGHATNAWQYLQAEIHQQVYVPRYSFTYPFVERMDVPAMKAGQDPTTASAVAASSCPVVPPSTTPAPVQVVNNYCVERDPKETMQLFFDEMLGRCRGGPVSLGTPEGNEASTRRVTFAPDTGRSTMNEHPFQALHPTTGDEAVFIT